MAKPKKVFRVLKGDVVHGPFTQAELSKLHDEGRFQWSELVSVEGGPWMKFEELFSKVHSKPPQNVPPEVPKNSEGIFYVFEGKKQGPVTETNLHSLFQSGEIRTSTLVWKKGLKNWVTLDESGLIDDIVGTYRISDLRK